MRIPWDNGRDCVGQNGPGHAKSIGHVLRAAVIVFVGVTLAACETTQTVESEPPAEKTADISTETAFSEAQFGVPASLRVMTDSDVPKGGGRAMVGKPYKVAGRWYTPAEDPDYNESGLASWYGPNFHGRKTANGEIYDQYHLSAAHPTFPLPSYARVTNEKNGRSVVVRVNDRGPFAHGRIIDVSSTAADLLDFKQAGVAQVNVEYVGPARLDGLDMPFLMASFSGTEEQHSLPPGLLLALNDTPDGQSLPQSVGAFGEASLPREHTSDAPVTVELPRVGPVPGNRPNFIVATALPREPAGHSASLAAGYSASKADATGASAIEALLDRPRAMTPDDVVGAWKRRQADGVNR